MEPGLQKLAAEFAGKASIVKVDYDDSPDLREKYAAVEMPTLVLLKDGKETGRLSTVDMAEIKKLIETAL